MTGFSVFFLFGLSCVVLPCRGKIIPPPGGKILYFATGSTVTLQWQLGVGIAEVQTRAWYFESSIISSKGQLVIIYPNKEPEIHGNILTGVTVKPPATLVLSNVNQSFSGTYKFLLNTRDGPDESVVKVVITVTPTVTLECSGPTTVDKGDNFTCICKGEGGNPPANVTWCDKDGVEIGEKGEEKQKLTLTNVDKTDSGNYTCKAFSHELAKSEKSIEIFVNFPPENVEVESPTKMAERGKKFTITCTAEAYPPPTFKIFYNETKLLINKDTYTISKVNDSHSGFYHCVATNNLGSSNSTPSYLRVGNAVETEKSDSEGLGAGAIAGIVIGVLVVVVVVAGVIYWFKCKPNGKDHGPKKDAEEKSKKKRGDENVYDAVNMDDKASGSRSSHELESPMNYAVLDKQALNTGAPKKPDRNAEESTAYASIDVGKVGQVEADLV